MKKIVFADIQGFEPPEGDPLADIGQVEFYYDLPTPETFLERCNDAAVIVWGWVNITREILDQCKALEMVLYMGIGPESQLDMKYTHSKGITICNTPHYGDLAVAEHGIALMFALARHVVQGDKSMRQGQWGRFEGTELRGATLGIVGLGGLGSELAAIGNALGMKVICHTKRPSPERAAKHNVAFVELDELMSTSDYIQCAPVLNDETRGIIGEHELGLMKKDTYLINVSRGPVVDQEALLKVLKEGRIAGYATDVYADEPPTNEPLAE
ncbi:MAG: 2-hydroxyacid dehydrogenase, partial [Dehalococcoidia bacterium]